MEGQEANYILFSCFSPVIVQCRRARRPNSYKPLSDSKPRFLRFGKNSVQDRNNKTQSNHHSRSTAQSGLVWTLDDVNSPAELNRRGRSCTHTVVKLLGKTFEENRAPRNYHSKYIRRRTVLVFVHEVEECSMIDWRLDLKRTFVVVITSIANFFCWRQGEGLIIDAYSMSFLDIELFSSAMSFDRVQKLTCTKLMFTGLRKSRRMRWPRISLYRLSISANSSASVQMFVTSISPSLISS